MDEEAEAYRSQKKVRLLREDAEYEKRLIDITNEQSKLLAERDNVKAKLFRLGSAPPSKHQCPECFYDRDIQSQMESRRHDNPNEFDSWVCRVCGYLNEVKI